MPVAAQPLGFDFARHGPAGIRVVDHTGTTKGWRIYDTHGNNVRMFKQENDNLHSVNHERRYDAWGGIVWQTGDPPMQGYCANIGHRKEPESELVYMRARYDEPSQGRFKSEDPAMDGSNWYASCWNDPVGLVDGAGQSAIAARIGLIKLILGLTLLDEIEALESRMSDTTLRAKVLDSLIEHELRTARRPDNYDVDAHMRMIRKEWAEVNRQLNRFKTYRAMHKESGPLSRLLKLMFGMTLVHMSPLDDIDLAADGLGNLEVVYGG